MLVLLDYSRCFNVLKTLAWKPWCFLASFYLFLVCVLHCRYVPSGVKVSSYVSLKFLFFSFIQDGCLLIVHVVDLSRVLCTLLESIRSVKGGNRVMIICVMLLLMVVKIWLLK